MSSLALLGGTPVRTRPFSPWPLSGEPERAALQAVLDSGIWGSIDGPRVRELEKRYAEFQDSAHAIATTSGTVGLVLALRALGVGSGDEVIVPSYTFLATASTVLEVNALPIFVDIDPDTYCIAPAAVEAAITPRTKAIVPVHLGGHPADLDRLTDIGRRHGIPIVEDAAQAVGAAWNGRRVGAIGAIGTWSFQASKNLNSGEGGMITTDDSALATACESLHNCGRAKDGVWYEHYVLGGNFRMTEFQGAMLLTQLDRLPDQIRRREASAGILDAALAAIPGLRPARRDPRVDTHAYHLYLFRYDAAEFGGMDRDRFVDALRAEGIPANIGYPIPLNKQPLFVNRAFDRRATGYDDAYPATRFEALDLPICEAACRETVWLPQTVLLGDESDMADVIDAITKIHHEMSAWPATAAAGHD